VLTLTQLALLTTLLLYLARLHEAEWGANLNEARGYLGKVLLLAIALISLALWRLTA
jgi:hypothetical protein